MTMWWLLGAAVVAGAAAVASRGGKDIKRYMRMRKM